MLFTWYIQSSNLVFAGAFAVLLLLAHSASTTEKSMLALDEAMFYKIAKCRKHDGSELECRCDRMYCE